MVEPTARSRLLAAVSVAQLATGVAGMALALRRRYPYDVLWMHGRADAIARDTIVKGTALSAPVSNLLAQAALTVLVARRPSRGAARALGGLGALQVAGYLGERFVRRRLRPSGWDAVESPLVLAGIGLAGAMAALGRQVQQTGRACPAAEPDPGPPWRGAWPLGSRRFAARRPAVPRSRPGPTAGGVLRTERRARQPHRAGPTVRAPDAQAHGQTLHRLCGEPQAWAAGRVDHWGPGRPLRPGHRQRIPRPGSLEGISTGGSIAQQFAIDHPQLVRRLVLAATACRFSPHGREVQRRFAALTPAGRSRRAYATLGPTLAATAAGGRAFAALMWLFGASQRVEDPSDMLVTVAAEDAFDASPELGRITAPTLMVAGGRDRFYSPELFWDTAERIPNARLRPVPGQGPRRRDDPQASHPRDGRLPARRRPAGNLTAAAFIALSWQRPPGPGRPRT